MPDTDVTCPDCGGKRFNPDTLEIKYKGKSIYDVLEMELDEVVILNRLVDRGASVLITEHNPDIVQCADQIIDLGPQGGGKGGEIVACGTPEEVARIKRSLTGKMLKDIR